MPVSISRNCPFRIGNTPVSRFRISLNGLDHDLCVKEERLNEFGSIKDRVAWYILSRSIPASGWTGHVIDASSGNYGYALACMGQRLGHRITIVSSPSISQFNADGIRRAGAELIIAETRPGESANDARMRVAGEISERDGALFLDQYRSALNPESHRTWTAPEVFSAARYDACFVAASSGGTTRGFTDFLAARDLPTDLILVEPSPSRAFAEPAPNCGKGLYIPGYGSGRRSSFADEDRSVRVLRIPEALALATQSVLTPKGLSGIGLSGAGVVAGAIEWLSGQTASRAVVCICADGAERYEDELQSRYLPQADGLELQQAANALKQGVTGFRRLPARAPCQPGR